MDAAPSYYWRLKRVLWIHKTVCLKKVKLTSEILKFYSHIVSLCLVRINISHSKSMFKIVWWYMHNLLSIRVELGSHKNFNAKMQLNFLIETFRNVTYRYFNELFLHYIKDISSSACLTHQELLLLKFKAWF